MMPHMLRDVAIVIVGCLVMQTVHVEGLKQEEHVLKIGVGSQLSHEPQLSKRHIRGTQQNNLWGTSCPSFLAAMSDG